MDRKHKDKPKANEPVRETITRADVGTVSAADLAQISATQTDPSADDPDKPKPEPGAPQIATSHGVAPRIVAGVASFSGHGGIATTSRAAAYEAAEAAAVRQAMNDGVSIDDSAAIKAYKETARRQVRLSLDRPVARD